MCWFKSSESSLKKNLPMTTKRFVKSFLLCITFCMALPCSAQEKEQEKDMVEVQFVSFPVITNEKPIELLTGEGELVSIELPSNNLSKTYKVVKPGQWVIGETVADQEGKEAFKPFGEAQVLDADKQIVVVTRKGGANADGFNLVPIADLGAEFKGGSYLMINVADTEISGALGNSAFAIKANHSELLNPEASNEKNGRNYLFTIFKHDSAEGAKDFYTNTWRFNDKARTMVFIYQDAESKQLSIRTIRSFLF
jgi:hypothetical protein